MTAVGTARDWLNRPCGRVAAALLAVFVCAAPGWMIFDPMGRSARDPVRVYRLHSDDWAYLAASRTWGRTVRNLAEPHNTHVVPTWRLLTWAVSAASGRLETLPKVLAVTSYGALVLVMLLSGRLVARESGCDGAGWAAAAATGTTSLMFWPATWYSAGQTLWAASGVVATLLILQTWKRSGGPGRLVAAGLMAVVAGGLWTLGHLAGPIGAVYLWVGGSPRARKAALVPLTATVLAAAVGAGLGAPKIDPKHVFYGRTARQALDPLMGLSHSAQAVTESLILGNLGLTAETTMTQAWAIAAALVAVWLGSHRKGRPFAPMELAGGGLLAGGYLIEWTFRGYLSFAGMRGSVPWYDAVPHVGAVLFVAGWWSGTPSSQGTPRGALSRGGAIGVVALVVALVVLNRPRVDAQWVTRDDPNGREVELGREPTGAGAEVLSSRSSRLARSRADWQRRALANFDRAESVARTLGIDRAALGAAFGRLDAPELVKAYDAAEILDLPSPGRVTDPDRVRAALGPLLTKEPEPPPDWLAPAARGH